MKLQWFIVCVFGVPLENHPVIVDVPRPKYRLIIAFVDVLEFWNVCYMQKLNEDEDLRILKMDHVSGSDAVWYLSSKFPLISCLVHVLGPYMKRL